MGMCMCGCRSLQCPGEDTRSLEPGVTGGYKPLDVGAQTKLGSFATIVKKIAF